LASLRVTTGMSSSSGSVALVSGALSQRRAPRLPLEF
jgi:hypothetical protein